jgi:two-component SAPR family response regulator
MLTGEGISLLLVEGDKNALDVCSSIIRRRFPQMVVHAARTPKEALTLFTTRSHDIVVTDIFSSTGEAGIKIAEEVCSKKPNVKVIFISSNTDHNLPIFQSYPRPLCLDNIINKPIHAKELISKIRNTILNLSVGSS